MDYLNTEMFDRVNQTSRDEVIIDADVIEVNNHQDIDWLWLVPAFIAGLFIGGFGAALMIVYRLF